MSIFVYSLCVISPALRIFASATRFLSAAPVPDISAIAARAERTVIISTPLASAFSIHCV